MGKYANKIKFLVMDVDGTLTDGKIYMGKTGEVIKAFDIKDGYAIKMFLPELKIIPVIITARTSEILKNRCDELDILEIHQGVVNKFDKLKEILVDFSERDGMNYTFENIAYVGDDNLDIQCMQPIKEAGGFAVCPRDAARDVIEISDFISTKKGGDGAIREFVEYLRTLNSAKNVNLNKLRKLYPTVYDFIVNFIPSKMKDGKYELGNEVFANVMSYMTKNANMTEYESHKKYIDIQYIIYGTEILMTENLTKIKSTISTSYNEKEDIQNYDYKYGQVNIAQPGDIFIFPPEVAHRGAISVDRTIKLRKIVVKIPVN